VYRYPNGTKLGECDMTAGGPVYFIGGTFGSGGGSGWIIAIITAVVTAFATFWVGYLLEENKRRRDVRALAETFIAEISSILQLFDELRIEERYRNLRNALQKLDQAATLPSTVGDGLTFPITVYEKCAERVGTLGGESAAGIVRFYNFVNGFRVCVRIAVSPGPVLGRIEVINFLLDALANERPKVEVLLRKLRLIATRHF
jgi:hypothetical protein